MTQSRIVGHAGPLCAVMVMLLLGCETPRANPPADPDRARALIDDGRYTEAEAVARACLEVAEQHDGPSSLSVAEALDLLVESLWRSGQLDEASRSAARAIEIKTSQLPADDPSFAITLSHQATILSEQGRLDEAKALYERSLELERSAFGEADARYGVGLADLGTVLYELGDYAGAGSRLELALEILDKDGESLQLAFVQTMYANVLAATGDHDEAKSYYERALAIRERHLAADHPQLAGSHNNLGALLYAMGDLQGARSHFERALEIRERAFEPGTPLVVGTRHNLAWVLDQLGDTEEADRLVSETLDQLVEALGWQHPYVAAELEVLGTRRHARGDLPAARTFYEQSVEIRQRVYGPDHPQVADTMDKLAGVLRQAGNLEEALDLALRAEAIGREHHSLTSRLLSERQALRYAQTRASGLGLALSISTRSVGGDAVRRVWDALIRSRAAVLDEMATRRRLAAQVVDPELERLWAQLGSAREALAELSIRGPDPKHPEAYRRELDEVRRTEERAERALGMRSVDFRQGEMRKRIGWSEVADSLPPRSALVAFALSPQADGLEDADGYLALVAVAGVPDPVVVPLGSTEEIDALVARCRRTMGHAYEAGSEGEYREAAGELRARVWDPLAGLVRGIESLFIVPDGSLNLVSFAALPVEGERYLVETGPMVHYLSTERDLVGFDSERQVGRGMLALGDPDFDRGRAALSLRPGDPPEDASRSQGGACGNLQNARFVRLPASAREVQEVAALWRARSGQPAKQLIGDEATESAFKTGSVKSRVLHLATHGFFLDQACRAQPSATRAITGLASSEELDNPLLLSGLALAGANIRDGGDGEDGIITAEEIAALDLSAVEWAVLSACDTGIGRVQIGEGVLGLRRAFRTAGVPTLVMSLWPVADESARDWMVALYRGRLDGLTTVEAVHSATLAVLRERRESKRSTHPFYWGGFVAAGDWH